MACLGAPSKFGLLVTAIPVLAFAAWLVWNLLRSIEKLCLARSRTLWSAYVAVWLSSALSVTKLLVQVFSARPLAWDVVSLVHSLGTLALQVAVISLLLHGFLGGFSAISGRRMTALLAMSAGLVDAGIRAALLFAAHVPLYYIQGCITTPANANEILHDNIAPEATSHTVHRALLHAAAAHAQLDDHGSNVGTIRQIGQNQDIIHIQSLHPSAGDVLEDGTIGDGSSSSGGSGVGSFIALAVQGTSRLASWCTSQLLRLGNERHLGTGATIVQQQTQQWGHLDAWGSGLHVVDHGVVHSGGGDGDGGGSGTRSLLSAGMGVYVMSASWADADCDEPQGSVGGWAYLLLHSVVLCLSYCALLLLPFTPLRNLLPAKRPLYRYLGACASLYAAAAAGALLAAASLSAGVCLWSVCMWGLDAGFAPLLYATFLHAPLSGRPEGDDLDEDLMLYSEMRDAGVFETDEL